MKKLLLVGGGHAHLHVLRELCKTPLQSVQVTLLSAARHQYYSGMFSGFLEGTYEATDISVDLQRVAQVAAIDWHEERVVSVDRLNKQVVTESGKRFSYDIISFNIGSMTAGVSERESDFQQLLIKPNGRIPHAVERLRQAEGEVVIVGGGAAGVELAFSLAAYWRNEKPASNHEQRQVILVTSGRILPSATEKQSAAVRHLLQRAGVEVREHSKWRNETIDQHPTAPHLMVTGPGSLPLFREAGWPTDENGFVLVSETLQSTEDASVFAAGDCATLEQWPSTDKAGVYAVRQAPLLWQNLRVTLETDNPATEANEPNEPNARLSRFRPQTTYLTILNAGQGRAILFYRGWMFYGRWCWQLKQWIDRRFLQTYKRLID